MLSSHEFCIWDVPFSEPGACSRRRKAVSNLLHCASPCVVPSAISCSYCTKAEEEVTFLTGAILDDYQSSSGY